MEGPFLLGRNTHKAYWEEGSLDVSMQRLLNPLGLSSGVKGQLWLGTLWCWVLGLVQPRVYGAQTTQREHGD